MSGNKSFRTRMLNFDASWPVWRPVDWAPNFPAPIPIVQVACAWRGKRRVKPKYSAVSYFQRWQNSDHLSSLKNCFWKVDIKFRLIKLNVPSWKRRWKSCRARCLLCNPSTRFFRFKMPIKVFTVGISGSEQKTGGKLANVQAEVE